MVAWVSLFDVSLKNQICAITIVTLVSGSLIYALLFSFRELTRLVSHQILLLILSPLPLGSIRLNNWSRTIN